MSGLLGDAGLLAGVAIRSEWRSPRALGTAVALAAAALVVAGLAAGPSTDRLRAIAPGLTWIALLYAGLATADRLDRLDRQDDAFTGIWLVAADRRALFLGRLAALTIALGVLQAVLWPLAVVLLDVGVGARMLALVPLGAISALALAAVCSVVVALTPDTAGRTLLLPVILLPLGVPVLLAGIGATDALITGDPAGAGAWTAALLLQAALFTGLGLLTYETVAAPQDAAGRTA